MDVQGKTRQDDNLSAYVLEHLNQAIAEGWIRPYYQAIVRSFTSELCGEEALAYWEDPVHGVLQAEQFAPILERADKLHELNLHIIDCIIEDMLAKNERGIEVVPVSIKLYHSDLKWLNVAETISAKVDAVGISRSLIVVEMAESAMLGASDNPALVKEQIRLLHQAGYKVWMKGFGGGCSAMNLLREYDFDVIKLDIGSIERDGMNERTREVLAGIMRIAERLGTGTLTEGVETEELAIQLEAMSCNMMQGDFFSRPLPLQEVIKRYESGTSMNREPVSEWQYWDAIGRVSLAEPLTTLDGINYGGKLSKKSPIGVVEQRDGRWRLLRANSAFQAFMEQAGLFEDAYSPLHVNLLVRDTDVEFAAAVERALSTGEWEMVAGRRDYAAKSNFFVRKVAETPHAQAFMMNAMPTMLGSSLGIFGDVPIAYAVFHIVYNEARDEAVDAEFIYANALYYELLNSGNDRLEGKTLTDLSPDGAKVWLPFLYRAAVLGERVHDVIFGNEINHWVSFSVAPSLISDCCSFAFLVVDDEQREKDQLEWAGTHDDLTGLLNRRGIDEATEKQVSEHPGEPFALALLDIDDFKTINDRYGHAVGDEALRVFARSVGEFFPGGTITGRYGGDELLIMLTGDSAERADELFEEFSSSFKSFTYEGVPYAMTVSVGYAIYPHDAENLAQAYANADAALYAVKLSGKAGSQRYSSNMNAQYRSQLGFTPRDIAENVPGGIMVHRAGEDGEILFVNDELIEMCECKDMAEFMELTGGSFRGIVHPDDSVRMFEEIVSQVSLDDIGQKGFCNYRIVTKSGNPCYVESNGRLVEVEGIGKVFYVIMIDLDERVDAQIKGDQAWSLADSISQSS